MEIFEIVVEYDDDHQARSIEVALMAPGVAGSVRFKVPFGVATGELGTVLTDLHRLGEQIVRGQLQSW